MADTPDWRVYERVTACFAIDSASMETSITPNASLTGAITGVKRQIDILIDARWEEGAERRIIYDAKRRNRKINVNDVEAFEGLMRDVCASRGVIVCTNGWTNAAIARAEEKIEIRLLSLDEVEDFDHAAVDPCPNCHATKRKTKGMVFWDGQFPLPLGGWAIIFTGKCDVCRSFAFWCWDCGEKMVVPDKEIYKCGCDRTWFIEMNSDEAVFIVSVDEGEISVDRRPLR